MGWHPQPEIQTHHPKNRNLPFPHARQNPRNQGFSRVETTSQGTNKEAVPRDPRTLRSPPSTPGDLIAPGTTTSQAPHDTSPNPVYNKRSGLHGNGEVNSRLGYGTKSSTRPRELSRPQAKGPPPMFPRNIARAHQSFSIVYLSD